MPGSSIGPIGRGASKPAQAVEESARPDRGTVAKEKGVPRSIVESRDSFEPAPAREIVPAPEDRQSLRPSDMVRGAVRSIAGRFERYENDSELSPPVYWNTNAPVDVEARRGRSEGITRELSRDGSATTRTTTVDGPGGPNVLETRAGDPMPTDSDGPWSLPVDVTLKGWWRGASKGTGIAARASVAAEGADEKAAAAAIAYSETRTNTGVGVRISPTGVEGGGWARARVVAAGALLTASAETRTTKVAGEDVNANVSTRVQPYVGAHAGTFVWATVDAATPKASVAVGGDLFAGAKAKGHLKLGLGDVLSVLVTGEAWAGAGAEAGASAGVGDGKVKLGASLGAGLGLGAKVGFEVELDAVAAARMARAAADRDGDGKLTLNDPAAGVAQGLNATARGLESGVNGVIGALDGDGDGSFSASDLKIRAGQAGEALEDGAIRAAKAVAGGVKATGRVLHGVADLDGDGALSVRDLQTGAAATWEATRTAANTVARVAGSLVRGTAEDARAAGAAVHRAADLDGDGSLSTRDLAVGAERAGDAIAAGARGAASAIADGAIAAARAAAKGVVAAGEAAGSAARAGAKAAHGLADRDNDGKLTVRDALAGSQQLYDSVASAANETGRAIHSAADRNGDGQLTVRDAMVGLGEAGDAVAGGSRAIARGGRAVASGVADAARTVGREVADAAGTFKDGAVEAYNRARAAVDRLAGFFGL